MIRQWFLALFVIFTGLVGCARKAADDGKIPVTTKSEDARKEFLIARDLTEKLLITNSIEHYDRAIALDPGFASAYLGRANSSFTGSDFFNFLNQAVAFADKASDGERLLILATEAGANGNAPLQKDLLGKLVAQYPKDERAHLNMGGYYFGQQDYVRAIEHYKSCIALSPGFSPAYNILGYAYRQAENYEEAEKVFKKYTELIPNDPNPYDSYGELLMKMGRFDESITQYRKALAIDPYFAASHSAIAANFMYKGLHDSGRAQLATALELARTDGERRAAMFTQTVLYADDGKLDLALKALDKQYALGEKTNDVAAMTGDLFFKAIILQEMGQWSDALVNYDKIVEMTDASTLSEDIKKNTHLAHHYNVAMVALGMNDLSKAKAESVEFRRGAEARQNLFLIRQAHQLEGSIAFAEKAFDKAILELEQSNRQNPYDMYRLAMACLAKGDKGRAKEYGRRAAYFNGLPGLNYAFVRTKATKLLSGL